MSIKIYKNWQLSYMLQDLVKLDWEIIISGNCYEHWYIKQKGANVTWTINFPIIILGTVLPKVVFGFFGFFGFGVRVICPALHLSVFFLRFCLSSFFILNCVLGAGNQRVGFSCMVISFREDHMFALLHGKVTDGVSLWHKKFGCCGSIWVLHFIHIFR